MTFHVIPSVGLRGSGEAVPAFLSVGAVRAAQAISAVHFRFTRPAPMNYTANMATRQKRTVDNDEWFKVMMPRMFTAASRRVQDTYDLQMLVELRQSLETAERTAVAFLKENGYTWFEIGQALGLSRQAAFARYGGT